MPEVDAYLSRILEKVQQLLQQCTRLQKENDKLKNELHDIKKTIKEKEEYVALLSLRIEVLKASKGGMTEDEKKSFEKTISQYLREIEKCIAYLND